MYVCEDFIGLAKTYMPFGQTSAELPPIWIARIEAPCSGYKASKEKSGN